MMKSGVFLHVSIAVILMIPAVGVQAAEPDMELKVDFGCPDNPPTFKQGWIPWEIPGGCSGRPHEGVWLNDIGGSGINAYLSSYDDLSMGNLRIGYGDAICNTNYQWQHPGNVQGSSRTFHCPGAPESNIELTFIGPGLTAGEYELKTYHCFPSPIVNMSSITAKGEGVTQLNEVKNISVQQVEDDEQLVPSIIRFYLTGQGPAKIIYEAGDGQFALETGKSSNPVINAFELTRVKPSLRPVDPSPEDKAEFIPSDTKRLSWKPGPPGTIYNVLFAGSAGDLDPESQPDITGLTVPFVDVIEVRRKGLKPNTEYFWRADYVFPDGRIARSDKWSFKTKNPETANQADAEPEGQMQTKLIFKVDLALPMADGVPYPGTAKEGWTIWADPAWYDMYAEGIVTLEDISSSGIDARLTLGYEGMGCLKVKGMRMHSKKGEGPPTGKPDADPICNTWYQCADWASHGGSKYYPSGYVLLAFYNLTAGTYNLFSYHNHWYYCDRYECDCLGLVEYRGAYRANKVEQGAMPRISAMSFADAKKYVDQHEIYREKHFLDSWNKLSKPAGGATGGVRSLKEVYNFTAQHVEHDEQLIPSIIRFKTDGSAVFVMYEAPQDYWDYRDYPGGRAILNAFRLERIIDSK